MIKLRDYQQEIVDATITALDTVDRVLVKSPTASGKSIMSLEVMRSFIDDGKSILIIAPQRELVEQLQATYSSLGNINLIKGKTHYNNAVKLNIGTLQTIYRRDITHTPDLVVIDEAHYGFKGKMLKQIFEMFKGTKFFFMSATPYDTSGKLLDGFDKVIDLYSTQDLISMGYLVDVEVYAPVAPNLSGIKVQSGDYINSQLDEKFNRSEIIDDIVSKTSTMIGSKQTIVYGINISHAENLSLSYREAGYVTAVVSSKTPTVERERIITAFKANEIQILTNVDILTTGIDIPAIECIVLARATKSQNLYHQIVGRGLRSSAGKTTCLILDCASTVKELGYPTDEIKHKPKKARAITSTVCELCSSSNTTLKDVEVDDVGSVYKIYSCKDCKGTFKLLTDSDSVRCAECGFISTERARGTVTKFSDHYELTNSCLNCGAESVYRTIDITDKELQRIHKSIDKYAKNLIADLIARSELSDVAFIVDECKRLSDADAVIPNHLHMYVDVDNLTAKVDRAISDIEEEEKALLNESELIQEYVRRGVSVVEANLIINGNTTAAEAIELGVLDLAVKSEAFINIVTRKLKAITGGLMVANDFKKLPDDIDMVKLILLLRDGINRISDAEYPPSFAKHKQSKRIQIAYFKVMEVYVPSLSGGFNLSTLGFEIDKDNYLLTEVA